MLPSHQNFTISDAVAQSLATAVAIEFDRFSRRCLDLLKKQRFQEMQKQSSMANSTGNSNPINQPSFHHDTPQLERSEAEMEERTQKINRIKEIITTRNIQNSQTSGNGSIPAQNNEVYDEKEVFEMFASQLGPRILLQYPTTSSQRVAKVISQKWESILPERKAAYLQRLKLKKARESQGRLDEEQVKLEEPMEEQKTQRDIPEQSSNAESDKFRQVLNRISAHSASGERENAQMEEA